MSSLGIWEKKEAVDANVHNQAIALAGIIGAGTPDRHRVLLCCTIVATSMWVTHYASFAILFVSLVVLASWWFKQRGALLSVSGVLLTLVVLNTLVTGSLRWRPSLLLAFTLGGLAMLLVGVLVGFLSYTLDLSHLARVKAQQAEKRLQQLHEIKNQFLLNVSHELRTPHPIARLPRTPA